jgi:hypothetical protein
MGEWQRSQYEGGHCRPGNAAAPAKRGHVTKTDVMASASPSSQRRVLRSSTRAANDIGEASRVKRMLLTVSTFFRQTFHRFCTFVHFSNFCEPPAQRKATYDVQHLGRGWSDSNLAWPVSSSKIARCSRYVLRLVRPAQSRP